MGHVNRSNPIGSYEWRVNKWQVVPLILFRFPTVALCTLTNSQPGKEPWWSPIFFCSCTVNKSSALSLQQVCKRAHQKCGTVPLGITWAQQTLYSEKDTSSKCPQWACYQIRFSPSIHLSSHLPNLPLSKTSGRVSFIHMVIRVFPGFCKVLKFGRKLISYSVSSPSSSVTLNPAICNFPKWYVHLFSSHFLHIRIGSHVVGIPGKKTSCNQHWGNFSDPIL